MTLPNGDLAVVDIAKLRDYCLSLDHPRGQHKARVFASVLGMTSKNAEELRDALLAAARSEAAVSGEEDQYGKRFLVDFEINGPKGDAIIRSAWIIRANEDFPRLTSCYVT